MDSSDEEDIEDLPSAFLVTTSQTETESHLDQKTILTNLPALSSPSGHKQDTSQHKQDEQDDSINEGVRFSKSFLEISSEDETKKKEQPIPILVKDSESEYESVKQVVPETADEKDDFSDEDIVSTSEADANVTVICKSKTEMPSTPETQASSAQSQGFQIAASASQKDTNSNNSNHAQNKDNHIFKSLQLSGEVVLVPETLDQSLHDSPEIIMSTPRIIPNSPTEFDIAPEYEIPTDPPEDMEPEVNEPKDNPAEVTEPEEFNEPEVKEPTDHLKYDLSAENTQDLALRLSPSQPYPFGDSPCQSLKYSTQDLKEEDEQDKTTSPQVSLHLSNVVDSVSPSSENIDQSSTIITTPLDKLSPETETQNEPGLKKTASLNIGDLESPSENISDTSFHLHVPHLTVNEETVEDNRDNVFRISKPSSFKRPRLALTEESSEDLFGFTKRQKVKDKEEITVIEKPMDIERDTVDSNAETQPSNETYGDLSAMIETVQPKETQTKSSCHRQLRMTEENSSSADDHNVRKEQEIKRKKPKKDKVSSEFIRPEQPTYSKSKSREVSVSGASSSLNAPGPLSPPPKTDFEEFTEAIDATLQKSSSSQEELEYQEITTKYKTIHITITDKRGKVVYHKTKKEKEDPIILKRTISREEVHHYESPRSNSTLSSGELGDIESLSRSNSSKSSLPQSLDKTNPTPEISSLSKQTSKPATQSLPANPNQSHLANTPTESPIEHGEVPIRTEVEISDVIFTSPDDVTKQQPEPRSETKITSGVQKQAADSSSQDTSEIDCAQKTTDPVEIPNKSSDSDGFSVKGVSIYSSGSSRKAQITTTPPGRGSSRKTPYGRGKQSKNKSSTKATTSTVTTTSTDTSKTSPEIPVLTHVAVSSSRSLQRTRPECYASKLEKGEYVMAKWKDGFYYPGSVFQIEVDRIKVSFDDGDVRFVNNTDVLLVRQLPVGQSVMVLSTDGYFDTGMILGIDTTTNDVMYEVEKDNGEKQTFPHSQVILSEDQAACLMSDEELRISQHGPKQSAANPFNVSLDNLVTGKRTRPGSAKKESAKKKPKEKPKPQSASASSDVGRNKKRPGGPMATSTPTPKAKGKRLNLDTSSSKPSQQATGSKLPQQASGSKRLNLDTSTSKPSQQASGSKLLQHATNKKLFEGMAFMLTHGIKTKEQKREEKKQLRDSSLDVSTDESSADDEDLNPFDKHELIELITNGGGVFLAEYDQTEINQYKQCFLISDSHHRTVKYMCALAAGLPCVSHLWILFSVSQDKLLDFKSFILPAGINLEKKKLCEWNSRGSCLAGLNVLVHAANKDFVTAWTNVVQIGRCKIVTKLPGVKSKIKVDVIISDNTCSEKVKQKATAMSIPIVSTEWVIQCLITGHIVNYTGHPKYKIDQ